MRHYCDTAATQVAKVISFYNSSLSRVYMLDQKYASYSANCRLALTIFYAMLDFSQVNSCVIYQEANLDNRKWEEYARRRLFLTMELSTFFFFFLRRWTSEALFWRIVTSKEKKNSILQLCTQWEIDRKLCRHKLSFFFIFIICNR